jgi:hypothetical protein
LLERDGAAAGRLRQAARGGRGGAAPGAPGGARTGGHRIRKETLYAAGWVILVTSLDRASFATDDIGARYRLRWRIALAFKRLNSLVGLSGPPAKDPRLAKPYILAHLLVPRTTIRGPISGNSMTLPAGRPPDPSHPLACHSAHRRHRRPRRHPAAEPAYPPLRIPSFATKPARALATKTQVPASSSKFQQVPASSRTILAPMGSQSGGCNIYVRSHCAGERVMASVSRFPTRKLRLKVSEAKSAVARPEARKFLGFSISNDGSERRIAPKAIDKFKTQIRDMTRRTRGINLPQLIEELTPYLIGWRGYFGFCQTPRVLTSLGCSKLLTSSESEMPHIVGKVIRDTI